MTITQRIKNASSALLARDDKKQPKPKMGREIGVGLSAINTYLENEVLPEDDVDIIDYRIMRKNDATVKALYNVVTLPILATEYNIVPHEEDDGEADFIKTKLIESNDMKTPFGLFMKDLLRGIEDGYRAFEKVMTVDADGDIVYKKLAPRDTPNLTILADAHGEFDGVRQRVGTGKKYVDVVIPKDRMFLYTFNKEMDYLYGESLYSSMRYNYRRKRRYEVLKELQAQTAAIPPRVAKTKQALDADAKSAVMNALDKFGVRQTITLPEGVDLEAYDVGPAYDLEPAIERHDLAMARSCLAHFIMLNKGGSYSLSKDQSDFLLMSLEAIAKDIAYHINTYLIEDLVRYNFADPKMPTFKFASMSDKTKSIVENAFTKLTEKGNLPEYMTNGIVENMATELGIDIPDEAEVQKEIEEAEARQQQEADAELARKTKGVKLARRLNEAEKRVNLSAVKKSLDTSESTFMTESKEIMDKLRQKVAKETAKIVEEQGIEGLKDYTINLNDYQKLIEREMLAVYTKNKQLAADELGVNIPSTPKDDKQVFKQNAQMVAEKTAEELLFIIKKEYLAEQRKMTLGRSTELGIKDVISRIAAGFIAFENDKISLAGAVAAAEALNVARSRVFASASNDVDRYEYSAIIDGRTSQICSELDGMVVTPEEYAVTQWKPPIHFNCRSIWVAILKDDDFKPDYTGIIDAPAGQTAPTLSLGADQSRIDSYIEELSKYQKDLAESREDKRELAELKKAVAELGVA